MDLTYAATPSPEARPLVDALLVASAFLTLDVEKRDASIPRHALDRGATANTQPFAVFEQLMAKAEQKRRERLRAAVEALSALQRDVLRAAKLQGDVDARANEDAHARPATAIQRVAQMWLASMEKAGAKAPAPSGLAAKVRNQLAGGSEWVSRDDREASDGVRRALRGRTRVRLAKIVAHHLKDEDVVIRSCAVAVAAEVAAVLGADPVAAIASDHPELFRDVTPQGSTVDHLDLWWSLVVAIGGAIGDKGRRAIELY